MDPRDTLDKALPLALRMRKHYLGGETKQNPSQYKAIFDKGLNNIYGIEYLAKESRYPSPPNGFTAL